MSSVYIRVALRRQVEKVSRGRCAYCQSPLRILGPVFQFDHIRPLAAGGRTIFKNLCLACSACNSYKGAQVRATDPVTGKSVLLFHPRRQNWKEHFAWDDGGAFVIGLTPVGRATVLALQLNNPYLVEARRIWVEAGWHPPTD